MLKRVELQFFVLLCSLLLSGAVAAACSPYMGLVTINEASKDQQNPQNKDSKDTDKDFVEIKLLDGDIPASVYDGWILQICENSPTDCTTIAVSTFDDTSSPWLVIKGKDTVGKYLNFAIGTDILLLDANSDAIDYLSTGGFNDHQPVCSFIYDDDVATDSSTRRVRRLPDGTGNWDAPPGNSVEPTEGDTNNGPLTAPSLTVSDITVVPGQTATFAVTLSAVHPDNEDVSFSFQTLDGTAISPSDYSLTTGSGVIVDGQTSATFTVPTNTSASIGEYFYVLITGVTNVVVTDQVGRATFSAPTVDHFDIDVGGGSASVCTPFSITVSACSNVACSSLVTDYAGTIDLATSTNHGNWSVNTGSGTLAPDPDSNNDGAVSYSFVVGDAGDVILDLSNFHAETLTVRVEDAGLSLVNTSTSVTFSENAFVISSIDSLSGDVVAGRDHSLRAEMVRRDPGTGVCAVATNYTVTDVKAWITRDGLDPGGATPDAISASETQNLPDSEPGVVNFALPFVAGVADFSLDTSDVGKYLVNFKDDSLVFSDQVISGSSANYVVRPFGFDVQVAGNPAAADENGAVFTTAASSFSVTVTAKAWAAADDGNNDGIADGHDDSVPTDTAPNIFADLSDNGSLLSFGQEGVAEAVVLDGYRSQPVVGVNPTPDFLSDDPGVPGDGRILNSFSAGTDTTAQVSFAEVGIIEIDATISDGDYLGVGAAITSKIIGRSGYVGRFVPFQFDIQNSMVTEPNGIGLNTFTYFDQPFNVDYDIEAQNASGVRTNNYHGNFAKLVVDDISYDAVDNLTPAVFDETRIDITSTTLVWVNGLATVNVLMNIDRLVPAPPLPLNAPLIDLQLGVIASDSDAVATTGLDLDVDLDLAFDHVWLGETTQRFGRLYIADAWGPESTGLDVPLQVEYWNGSVWVLSAGDETQIQRTDITFTDSGGGANDISGDPITAPVGANTSVTFTYDPTGNPTIDFGDGAGGGTGDSGMFVGPPGATGFFTVDVNLTNYGWLRFDWDQDGDYDNDTDTRTATITFQTYRGHDRVIYWLEVLQQ